MVNASKNQQLIHQPLGSRTAVPIGQGKAAAADCQAAKPQCLAVNVPSGND